MRRPGPRTRRLRGVDGDTIKLDMTPMIDVVFQLLVFFMCTIQFRTLEGKLSAYLPREGGERSLDLPRPPERVRVAVRVLAEGARLDPRTGAAWSGTGPFAHGPDRALAFDVGPRRVAGPRALAARLAELHAATPDRGLTIDAGPGTTYADLVSVLDTAAASGFTDIAFAGYGAR